MIDSHGNNDNNDDDDDFGHDASPDSNHDGGDRQIEIIELAPANSNSVINESMATTNITNEQIDMYHSDLRDPTNTEMDHTHHSIHDSLNSTISTYSTNSTTTTTTINSSDKTKSDNLNSINITIFGLKTNASDSDKYAVNKYDVKIFRWLLIYFCVWAFFGFILLFLFYADTSILTEYWEYCYLIWLFFTSTIKWILQKIGRKIDITIIRAKVKRIRIKYKNNYKKLRDQQLSNIALFSMEWQTEILLSIIYWQIYRQYVTYYLTELRLTEFIFTITVHLFSEFCQTSFRLTRHYFDKTSEIQDNLIEYDHCCCGIFGWIRNKLYDDSTYKQWVTRAYIDIVLRFLVSIVTAIYVTIFLILSWKKGFHFSQSQFNTALIYTIVSLFVELIGFGIVFLFHYCYYKRNMLNVYRPVWYKFKKWFIMAWICGAVMWFPFAS